jgi:hypothetical protein
MCEHKPVRSVAWKGERSSETRRRRSRKSIIFCVEGVQSDPSAQRNWETHTNPAYRATRSRMRPSCWPVDQQRRHFYPTPHPRRIHMHECTHTRGRGSALCRSTLRENMPSEYPKRFTTEHMKISIGRCSVLGVLLLPLPASHVYGSERQGCDHRRASMHAPVQGGACKHTVAASVCMHTRVCERANTRRQKEAFGW